MTSIRLIFPIIFAMEIVIAVSLTAAIGYASQMKEARETATRFLDLIAGTIDDQLDRYLSVPANLTRIYANEARKRRDVRFDKLLNPALVRDMIDSFQTQIHISRSMNINFANPTGQNLMLDRRGQSKPVVKLSDFGKGGAISWYTFDTFRSGGEPLETQPLDYDPRKQPFYIDAVTQGQPIVSSFYFSSLVKGAPVVTVAEPVYDERGKVRVVVSSDIDLWGIGIYLQGLRLPDAAVVFIFDSDGYLIAGSRRQTIDSNATGGRPKSLPLILQNPEPSIRSMAEHLRKQFSSFYIPKPIQFQFVDGNDRHYAYATPLAEKFGLNWKLAVVIPESGLIDNLIQAIYSVEWVSLVLLIIAIAVGLLTAAWMIHPILTMGAVALALEKNELTEPPLPASQLLKDTRRRNEFGRLAQVFLRMIDEIKARQCLLETQLEQLRVDIDHEHTRAQVQQISSTEFFQNLKSRARQLRDERNYPSERIEKGIAYTGE